MNRKVLLAGIGLLLSLGVVISGCGSESDFASSGGSFQNAQAGPVPSVSSTPQSALDELKAGNARYVAGTNQQLFRTSDRPLILNSTQAPIAMILSCADSRVTPELAFDQAWGQLFVVRVAGPVADQNGVGSFEFGHTVLGSKLLVVLGHEQCGAVNAA